ncbi:MAG: hypothetical protein QMD53_01360 [Actinomycetota bacterium]|nr:hypothetical protein [Actinomycetota bacterium]
MGAPKWETNNLPAVISEKRGASPKDAIFLSYTARFLSSAKIRPSGAEVFKRSESLDFKPLLNSESLALNFDGTISYSDRSININVSAEMKEFFVEDENGKAFYVKPASINLSFSYSSFNANFIPIEAERKSQGSYDFLNLLRQFLSELVSISYQEGRKTIALVLNER